MDATAATARRPMTVPRGLALALLACGLATEPRAETAPRPREVAPSVVAAAPKDDAVRPSIRTENRLLRIVFPVGVQAWDATEAARWVQVSPALACAWAWVDDRRLECRPDAVEVGRRYTVRLAPGLRALDGRAVEPGEAALVPAPLRIDLRVTGWDGALPQVRVANWQDVDLPRERLAAELAWYRSSGVTPVAPGDLTPETTRDGRTTAWRVALPADLGRPERLMLRLRDSVEVPGVETPVVGTAPLILEAGQPMRLTDAGCLARTDGCARYARATLRFSRMPERAALEAALPEGLALESLHQDWDRQRRDEVMRVMPGVATLRVLAPVGTRLAVDLGGLLDPPAADEAAGWRAGEVVVTPASPTLRIEAEEQRLAPGEAPHPAWRATATPATRQFWTRIDAGGLRSGESRLPAVAEGEERVLPAHPASVRRLQRRGGLLLVTLEDTDRPMAEQVLAWGEHAITVHRSGDEWLAWVTRFDDAAPVGGLRVDWLAGDDGRVLGGATTDADGVARLRLPSGGDGRAPGFVRAGGAVTSVLRLEQWGGVAIDAGEDEGPQPGWEPRGERFSLGLTDRPYARPGEAVQFVLWARRAGRLGALAPEPFAGGVMLALERGDAIGGGDPARLRWRVEATPDGRLAGRVVLPQSLPDGLWCIRPLAADADTRSRWQRRTDADQGACLQVGGAEARSTWLALSAPDALARPGETLAVGLEGGFLSGGPAAEGEVRVSAGLAAASPVAADDPVLGGFRFLDQPDDAEPPSADALLEGWPSAEATLKLDLSGRAALSPRVRADAGAGVPAFATLTLDALLLGRDGTATGAPPRQLRVALAERYVGLKHRLDDEGRGRWEAVVVDASGRPVADAGPVRITPTAATSGDATSCVLADAGPGRCPALDALLARQWQLEVRASAAGAHPVRMPVWRWGWDRGEGVRVEAGATAADGARALTLVQPWAASSWLLVVEHEGVLATHRVDARGPRTAWTLPWRPDWPRQVRLTAIAVAGDEAHAAAVAEAAASDRAAPGRPLQATSLTLLGPDATGTAATLGFERERAAPGDTVGLRLHNPGSEPLRLSVSVVDEGLLALDPDHATREPQSSEALAAWRAPRRGHAQLQSLLQMPRGPDGEPSFRDWRSREDEPIAYGPAPVAAAPPAPAPPADFAADPHSLDRVEVTGSRIARADAAPVAERPPADARPPHDADADAGDGAPPAPAALRLRQRFDDLAAWHEGLVLAPGETRVLEVGLPDGLTRWRARAWAERPDGAIALAEATLEASLPLEARLSVPASLRRGDRARLTLALRERERDATSADTRLEARGAGVDATRDATLALRRDVQARASLEVQPQQTGRLEVTGTGRRDGAADGVLRGAPVLPDAIDERWSQAFWAGTAHGGLALPALPPGADGARLQLRVGRLGSALAEAWEGDLHAYPHRCIEQRLSRAIGAALALERNGGADWPDAQGTIDEAFRELRGHIDASGGVHAWPGGARAAASSREAGGSPVLAAWVLRALDALEALGHPVPDASIRPQLVEALAGWRRQQGLSDDARAWQVEALAEVESVLAQAGRPDPRVGEYLRGRLERLGGSDWHLAALWRGAAGDAEAREALRPRVLAALGTDDARPPSDGRWMGSLRRDACTLLEAAAADGDISTDALLAPTRRMADLWSGGHDSHAGATCLLALRAARARLGDDEAPVDLAVRLGDETRALRLDAGQRDATLHWDAAPAGGRLAIEAEGEAPALLGVVATRGWRMPARGLDAPAGLGLGVRRDYAVLREGAWVPLRGPLRQDEIVRVHLRVDAGATRHHVALVDAVPGGLEPVDPAATATAGGALERFATPSAWAFDERQTGRVEVKLYADTLPQGTHDVYWYARARHVGEYLAVPAEASLMYGEASRGRSESAVIRIVEAPAAR